MSTKTEEPMNLKHLAKHLHITHKVNMQHMESMTFDQLFEFIGNSEVVQSTKDFLQTFYLHCSMWYPHYRANFCNSFNVRIFLVAYIMHLHPNRGFVSMIQETDPLIQLAKTLVEDFEWIVAFFAHGKHESMDHFREKTMKFFEVMKDYLDKFATWKDADNVRVAGLIKNFLFKVQGAIFRTAGECGEVDPLNPLVLAHKERMNVYIDRMVNLVGINEAFLFNQQVEAYVEERRQLRVLREEQRRSNSSVCFDFVE